MSTANFSCCSTTLEATSATHQCIGPPLSVNEKSCCRTFKIHHCKARMCSRLEPRCLQRGQSPSRHLTSHKSLLHIASGRWQVGPPPSHRLCLPSARGLWAVGNKKQQTFLNFAKGLFLANGRPTFPLLAKRFEKSVGFI